MLHHYAIDCLCKEADENNYKAKKEKEYLGNHKDKKSNKKNKDRPSDVDDDSDSDSDDSSSSEEDVKPWKGKGVEGHFNGLCFMAAEDVDNKLDPKVKHRINKLSLEVDRLTGSHE